MKRVQSSSWPRHIRISEPHSSLDRCLTARGRSPDGRVTAKRGRIQSQRDDSTSHNVTTQRRNNVTTQRHDDETMRIHWEELATTKTAPFRRNPLGAGGAPTFQTEAAGAPQALSGIVNTGHDEKTAPAASVSNLGARSSLRARNPKTPARGPRDFSRGLLSDGSRVLCAREMLFPSSHGRFNQYSCSICSASVRTAQYTIGRHSSPSAGVRLPHRAVVALGRCVSALGAS